jgi:Flp pilus assembly protein TadG
MKSTLARPLSNDIKGTTALEFALVSLIVMTLIIGAMEVGLTLWTRGTLQSIAARTARCAAITATACTTVTPAQYAANLANAWLASGMIQASNVTVTTATTCFTATGTGSFEVVTITASPWAGTIAYPLGTQTETVKACYPI